MSVNDNIKSLERLISGKNIFILGYGREGQSTYNLLRKHFPAINLTIADAKEDIADLANLKKDKKLKLDLGKNYLENISKYNLIIKSPGIALHKAKVKITAAHISSQTDLFLKIFSDQVIGITGTKGKSTTTSLIYQIVKSNNSDAVLVGNIGIPPFDAFDNITDETVIVYEFSSHQLDNITVSPHIAIILNLFEEHLDYYDTFEDYITAKINITRFQMDSDYFIFNSDSESIVKLLRKYYKSLNYYSYSLDNDTDNGCIIRNNKVIFISEGKLEQVYDLSNKRFLKGKHNELNIMAAIIACKLVDIPSKLISDGIDAFKGLSHRLEYVGKFKGIEFYNDSIATIPEATIEAVKTLKTVDTLILGGFDRGIHYTALIDFLLKSDINNLIFIDTAGERMLKEFNAMIKDKSKITKKTSLVKNMKEAVKIAKANTAKNKTCLLSPAAASYGMFKDFEERGNIFMKLVKE